GDNPEFDQLGEKLSDLGHPGVHLRVQNEYALGWLIFLWEIAVAVVGKEISIHPFNQPNVESAKVLARESVAAYQKTGNLPKSMAQELSADSLKKFLAKKQAGDYISLQAYIQPTEGAAAALKELQSVLRDQTRLAVTVGFGPRFLHSTGQLHKGGKNNGLFVQFVSHPEIKVEIPEKAGEEDSFIDFGVLKQAQAIGDAKALTQAGRRVIVFNVLPAPDEQFQQITVGIQAQ
ncbi:MAG: hypothetical protein ACK2T7_08885, partial [Anaerolineales bacterium]